MFLPALDPEEVHHVGPAIRQFHQRGGAPVLVALAVSVGGGLDHLDRRRRREQFEGGMTVFAILVFAVHGHHIMSERDPGPGVPRVIPDVSPVGHQFLAQGAVQDAECIVDDGARRGYSH